MNKNAKILVVGGVLAVGTLNAYAASVVTCANAAGTSIVGNSSSFIKDTFTPKCSGGVSVAFIDNASSLGVKAGSSKGMHTFGGSTEGGGITQCESSSVASPTTGLTAMNLGCTN